MSVTEVRSQISRVVDEVVDQHRPKVVDRNRRDHFVMLGSEEIGRLLEGFEFHPEVFEEDGAVGIWLPEFGIYGRGSSFDDAKEDLLAEARTYVEEYLDEADAYLRAPNRRDHFPFVLRAVLADIDGRLEEIVFMPSVARASEAGP